MQEYINELQQKAGLTAEQAKKAIETIIAKVKSKVPESFHGGIDSIFAGQGESIQQKYQAFSDQAEEKLKAFGGQAKEQLSDFADKAEDIAGDVQQKADEMIKGLEDKLSDFLGTKTKTPPTAEKP
ncbi:MAG TPA: phage tail tape measure C-terminal domain-containing protein [Chitinophagaceae bacterium]|jgi:hypothetical protein|nr:phage tail tape measure C-terminal domain-containing protein [Chitinophagaceae bacterium]